MSDPVHDGFLHRWARRKSLARTGALSDEASTPVAPAQPDGPAPDAASPAPHAAEPRPPEVHHAPAETDDAREAPALTLDDVRALTSDSDFAPFVSRQVAPEVKNAALKKLFADPHFNIMDGLDIYIDDYSAMEPMPQSMLRRLASAHALRMFDPADDADAPAPAPAAAQAPQASPADEPAGRASAGEEADADMQGRSRHSADAADEACAGAAQSTAAAQDLSDAALPSRSVAEPCRPAERQESAPDAGLGRTPGVCAPPEAGAGASSEAGPAGRPGFPPRAPASPGVCHEPSSGDLPASGMSRRPA